MTLEGSEVFKDLGLSDTAACIFCIYKNEIVYCAFYHKQNLFIKAHAAFFIHEHHSRGGTLRKLICFVKFKCPNQNWGFRVSKKLLKCYGGSSGFGAHLTLETKSQNMSTSAASILITHVSLLSFHDKDCIFYDG